MEKLVPGSLFLILLIDPEQFRQKKQVFVRKLGRLLRVGVRVKQDPLGRDMIYAWSGDVTDDDSMMSRSKRWAQALLGSDGTNNMLSRHRRAIRNG